MTISSEVRKAGPFSGNDVTTEFSFSFKVFSTADVLVVRADSKGAEYTLELGTDYTVSLNANQNTSPGGTVVKASPLVTGDKIVITSRVANLQPTDLTNQGGFYPAVINAALDRATIQIQQLSEKVNRSAKLPITRTEDVDALLSDIVVLADNLTSVNTVAGSIGSVNTVAGVSADVSTVAGNIANINAAVADLPALSAKVSKTGDTMTGHLSVPAGASGAQVPQAQEIGTLANAQLTTHYKRSNILGTVSQSGGVPTGAIIERGSNANGTYIRWADGTQLCICTPVTISTSTSVSPLARGSSGVITYPASFSEVFGTSTSATSGTNGSGVSAVLGASPGLSSIAELRGWGVNTSQTTDVTLTVIGRWF